MEIYSIILFFMPLTLTLRAQIIQLDQLFHRVSEVKSNKYGEGLLQSFGLWEASNC